jgi:HPt (histidine-containing phosphotransfer) domain-containing protein
MQTNEQNQIYSIAGIDMAKGLAMLSGSQDAYRQILTTYSEDVEERLKLLRNMPGADTLSAFITSVHALKSASASVGAMELSAQALGLETAGKAGDMAFIRENLPVFAKHLEEIAGRIKEWEKNMKERDLKEPASASGGGNDSIMSLLRELAQALKLQKADDIDEIMERIMAQPLDTDLKTAIEQISDEVLVAEYDKAMVILNGLLK